MDIILSIIHNVLSNDDDNIEFDKYISAEIYNKHYEINNNNLIILKRILFKEWNGIDLNSSKKDYQTFKQYFDASKTWFDSKKKVIFITNLWIPLFNMIINLLCGCCKKIYEKTG